MSPRYVEIKTHHSEGVGTSSRVVTQVVRVEPEEPNGKFDLTLEQAKMIPILHKKLESLERAEKDAFGDGIIAQAIVLARLEDPNNVRIKPESLGETRVSITGKNSHAELVLAINPERMGIDRESVDAVMRKKKKEEQQSNGWRHKLSKRWFSGRGK